MKTRLPWILLTIVTAIAIWQAVRDHRRSNPISHPIDHDQASVVPSDGPTKNDPARHVAPVGHGDVEIPVLRDRLHRVETEAAEREQLLAALVEKNRALSLRLADIEGPGAGSVSKLVKPALGGAVVSLPHDTLWGAIIAGDRAAIEEMLAESDANTGYEPEFIVDALERLVKLGPLVTAYALQYYESSEDHFYASYRFLVDGGISEVSLEGVRDGDSWAWYWGSLDDLASELEEVSSYPEDYREITIGNEDVEGPWPGDVLDVIYRAQRQWIALDVDRNGNRDYWKRDVAGLWGLPGVNGKPNGLLPKAIADADSLRSGSYPGLSAVANPIGGYLLRVMESGSGGAGSWGVTAYPASYDAAVDPEFRMTYILDANGDYGQRDVGGAPQLTWPNEAEIHLWRD